MEMPSKFLTVMINANHNRKEYSTHNFYMIETMIEAIPYSLYGEMDVGLA